jgi:hypothetical protein
MICKTARSLRRSSQKHIRSNNPNAAVAELMIGSVAPKTKSENLGLNSVKPQ